MVSWRRQPLGIVRLYTYDNRFFDSVDFAAAISADHVLSLLAKQMPIKSVLDLGCGQGVWLASWVRLGAADVQGIDGPYVDQTRLKIPKERFQGRDLARPVDLGRQFDLVQSLEVAEHLPESAAEQFVDSLTRHGPLVLFSSATPGQGGENHINEQPWQYWREKFAARGYEVFDFLRPRLRTDRSVYVWYRHNTLLYVHRSIVASLPAEIAATLVPADRPLANPLPYWIRLRRVILRRLPRPIIDMLARVMHNVRSALYAPQKSRL